jgi:esterase/lipase superfamily enzyme
VEERIMMTTILERRDRLFHTLVPIALACTALGGCKHGRELMPTPTLYVDAAENPFADVAPAYQTSSVSMLYATDRVPEQVKGELHYGYGRSPSLAFGECVVSVGADMSWEDLVRNSRVSKRDVKLPIAVATITELGRFPDTPPIQVDAATMEARVEGEFLVELRRRLALTPRKEAFIFIHGYHDSFAAAACTAAEMWHFLGRTGVPIVYTWPAGHGGLLKGYDYDQESGIFTVYHFKQLMHLLASCEELESISILAHSRGTVVAVDGLRELVIEARAAGHNPQEALKLNNVILAAADLDIMVASQRVAAEDLEAGVIRATAYVSQRDKALGLSDWLFADRRFGTLDYGDLTEFERSIVRAAHRTSFVDSRIHTKGIGHGYFHSAPAVSSDLILVLRDNRDPGAANGRPLTPVGGNYWELEKGYPNMTPVADDQR